MTPDREVRGAVPVADRTAVCARRRGGLAGVFKGLEAKMLQTVITAALMFVLYEKIAHFVFLILLGRRRS